MCDGQQHTAFQLLRAAVLRQQQVVEAGVTGGQLLTVGAGASDGKSQVPQPVDGRPVAAVEQQHNNRGGCSVTCARASAVISGVIWRTAYTTCR